MATALSPVLSKWANAQHRNVFIWTTYGEKICMSWRVDKYNEMTIEAMYRWFDAVKKETSYARGYSDGLDAIYPVDVKRNYWPLSYAIEQEHPGLSRGSKAVLSAGNYGIYKSDGTKKLGGLVLDKEESFALSTFWLNETDLPLASFTRLSPSIVDNTLKRDQQCVLTGIVPAAPGDLHVTWIVPPDLYYLVEEYGHNRNRPETDINATEPLDVISKLMVVENCLSMTKDIAALFNENKIGIDADDNYRIICFDVRDEVTAALKTHMRQHVSKPHGPRDDFLRAHFTRCLVVNTCDGDVREQFPQDAVTHFFEGLGYAENMDDLALDEEEKEEFREEWNTELGQVLQKWIDEREV